MSKVLKQLAKLIALANPPATGSDEEAKAAAMKVCAMIREHNLYVYDPHDKTPTSDLPPDAESLQARLERVKFSNPVNVAMRKRKEERERVEQLRRERAPHVVG